MANKFYRSRILSFGYAVKGLKKAFSTQTNFRIQVFAAFCVILLSFFLNLTPIEWCLIILCISITLTAEAMNTAIEFTVDHVCPERHDSAEKIKDIAAAAVLISSIGSAAIGAIVLLPKIICLF